MRGYDRRSVLRGLAGTGLLAVAGCNGGQSQDQPEGGSSGSDDGTTTSTPESQDPEQRELAFLDKVHASDPGRNDQFGHAVASGGDTVVVGAHQDDFPDAANAGSATVFRREGDGWTEQATLAAEDGDDEDRFGSTVDVSGDVVLVGAGSDDDPNASDAGSAYVFELVDGTWTQRAKLAASDGGRLDHFAEAVALEGTRALIGAWSHAGNNGNDAGAAYVFERAGEDWVEREKLAPLNLDRADHFGRAVALSGETAVVGAPRDEDPNGEQAGTVYPFDRAGGSWDRRGRIVPDDGAPGGHFGRSLALDGTTLLVGAPHDGPTRESAGGVAYVYERVGDDWVERARLTGNGGDSDGEDSDTDDQFGHAVALAGDVAMVGAPADEDLNGMLSGSVYVYRRSGGSWSRIGYISARHGRPEDNFGRSVDVQDGLGVVGVPREDIPEGHSAGSAHLYTV